MASLPSTRAAARCGMSLMPRRRASRGQDAGDVLSHDASPPASSHANRARPPAPRAEAKVPHHTGHHPRAASATSTRPADSPCPPRPGWPPPRSAPPAGPPHPGHPAPPRAPHNRPGRRASGAPLARAAGTPPPPCQARGGPASAGDPMPRAGSPTINGRERQQSRSAESPGSARTRVAQVENRSHSVSSVRSPSSLPIICNYVRSGIGVASVTGHPVLDVPMA